LIITWPFPYRPWYHPETPISAQAYLVDETCKRVPFTYKYVIIMLLFFITNIYIINYSCSCDISINQMVFTQYTLTILIVISTDCIDSFKYIHNYHTTTTTTVPLYIIVQMYHMQVVVIIRLHGYVDTNTIKKEKRDDWKNRPRINMSLYSNTLSWFLANQSFLFLINAMYLAEKQHILM
jgi:hypothetical protein